MLQSVCSMCMCAGYLALLLLPSLWLLLSTGLLPVTLHCYSHERVTNTIGTGGCHNSSMPFACLKPHEPPCEGCHLAAVGKSSLICHLAEEEVSEVLHSGAGSIRPKDCSIDCNGLAWKAVDIPGCNGLHMAKGWIGREVSLSPLAACLPDKGGDSVTLAAAF